MEKVKSVGWFQAAGNIGFTVLGLLYGQGDMLQSLLYAVNCGDDTDCTAGTVGAVLGILQGASGIDASLKEYVGDRIVTISINGSYRHQIPKTCTELSGRVLALIPEMFAAHGVQLQWTQKDTVLDRSAQEKLLAGHSQAVFSGSPWSFEVPGTLHTHTYVEYDRAPIVKPGEEFRVKITLRNLRRDAHYYMVTPYLPEGWSAEYNKTVAIRYLQRPHQEYGLAGVEMVIRVGESVAPVNRFPIVLYAEEHAIPITIPMVLLG